MTPTIPTEPRKGMLLTVLRSALGDCTNGGITSKATSILVVGSGIPEIFEESDRHPTVEIASRAGHLFLRPTAPCPKGHVGYMMGGNFAYTCDSRWKYSALPVHDRTETTKEYASYSD